MKKISLSQVQKDMVGKTIETCGWVQRIRNLGSLLFIELKDRTAVLQLIVDTQKHPEATDLGLQDCIWVNGAVRERPPDQRNAKMVTGDVELVVKELKTLAKCKTPPFVVENDVKAGEELRLRYRYLDLRREVMQKNLIFRHKVVTAIREYLNIYDFLEIETPIMTRAMPEGARDYLVPSRLYPGKFYALAQSPQMYKQLLMVAGFERYYQIARCMRDEDPRHDRQPEHTQIDIEMSFINEEDIYHLVEGMFSFIFKKALGQDLTIPFPRYAFQDVIAKYGSDKPDISFGLEIKDFKEAFQNVDFAPFRNKQNIRGIIIPEAAKISRKHLEEFGTLAKTKGLENIYWVRKEENFSGSIAKVIDWNVVKNIDLLNGCLLILATGDARVFSLLGELRNRIADQLDLRQKGFHFLWVHDFPLFERDEKTGAIVPCHHIFTQPKEEDLQFIDTDPVRTRGRQYDLVCNGNELASGSIRNHNRQLQEKLFSIIGIDRETAGAKFGLLLDALEYAAPPHGGIAPGIDRICMVLGGIPNIREVIAFPKTTTAQGLLENIPDVVDPRQLKDLHLKIEE
jgi:aspartyl-tRNA synthetase